jgi:hypothetical protein
VFICGQNSWPHHTRRREWSKQRSGGETSTATTGSSEAGSKIGAVSTAAVGSSIVATAVVNTAADGSSQVFVIFLQCPEGSQQPPAFTGAQARQAPETKAATSSITSPILAIARITVYCGNCNQRTITHRPHFQQRDFRTAGGYGPILGYPVYKDASGPPYRPARDRAALRQHLVRGAVQYRSCPGPSSAVSSPAPNGEALRDSVLVEAPHSPAPSPLALLGVAPQAAVDPVVSTRQLDPPPAFVSPPAPPIATPLRA